MSYPPAQHIQILYQRFKEFIAPETDRYYMLKSLLDELRLDPQRITISGNRHLFLSSQGAFLNQIKSHWARNVTILVAHYDRVPNSPGANDNGAAVFELIEAALKLREEQIHQWFIIFTDKEELAQGEGIRDQGSYTLAKGLRDAGLGNSRFYIFDACGVGDTLRLSYETGKGTGYHPHENAGAPAPGQGAGNHPAPQAGSGAPYSHALFR